MFHLAENNQLSLESQKLSFPRKFRHKLCSLRQELIESFVDSKYVQFVKFAAIQIQQLNNSKKTVVEPKNDENSTTEASENKEKQPEKEIEDAKQLIKELTSNNGEI